MSRLLHPISTFIRWVKGFFPNLRDAGIRWNEDDASSMAASVAYYLALSLFPMMLLLTSGIGIFLRFSNLGQDAEQQILSLVQTYASPVVEKQIEQVLKQLQNHSLVSGPFGFLAATLAAIGVFAQIDRGFDRIFRIPAVKQSSVRGTIFRVLRHRFLAFLMLLSLGGMILILFAASMMIAQLRSLTGTAMPSLVHVFGAFELCFAVLANALLFTLVYRWLPKKRVMWLDAIRGGLLAALIWELGREILGVFLIGMRYTSAYGAIGSFIAILLWCYYGISIIFFGAEYVQVLAMRRQAALNHLQPDTMHASTTVSLVVGGENQQTHHVSAVPIGHDESFDDHPRRTLTTSSSDKQKPRRTDESVDRN